MVYVCGRLEGLKTMTMQKINVGCGRVRQDGGTKGPESCAITPYNRKNTGG